MRARSAPRALAGVALALAALGVLAILLGGRPEYRITAIFDDGGQLVKGNLVEVAGRPVGTITAISLTPDGRAAIELKVTDASLVPLHEGTIATIRAVGLSAVANRFIELDPGPRRTPKLRDGGTLPRSQTRGIVDLDTLMNAMTPTVRGQLQSILHDAATAVSGPAAGQLNDSLASLDPALAQTAALGRELTGDQAALDTLVRSGATVATTLARRQADLGTSLDGAAQTLRTLADERRSVADLLERTPATARRTQRTLANLDGLLPQVDRLLRDARPTVPALARVLRRTVPLTRNAKPAVGAIRTLLAESDRALRPLPRLDRAATPAIVSTGKALTDLLPIVAGLRVYAPDVIGGFFNGFGGSTGGYYDANGHMLRISLQGSSASLAGLVPPVPENPIPVLGGYRTGLVARCPGGAEEAAPDGSNPWRPEDQQSICDPADNHRP